MKHQKKQQEVPSIEALVRQLALSYPLTWLIINIKGGVGKSSLARAAQLILDAQIVTNDLCSEPSTQDVIHLDPRQQSLKKVDLSGHPSVVFDLGASYGQFDPRIAQAVRQADVILIPTGIEHSEIEATIQTYRWLADEGKPLVIIYNQVAAADHERFAQALHRVEQAIGQHSYSVLRKTTLFRRMLLDGASWSERVFNERGLSRLRQPWQDLCELFHELTLAYKKEEL